MDVAITTSSLKNYSEVIKFIYDLIYLNWGKIFVQMNPAGQRVCKKPPNCSLKFPVSYFLEWKFSVSVNE